MGRKGRLFASLVEDDEKDTALETFNEESNIYYNMPKKKKRLSLRCRVFIGIIVFLISFLVFFVLTTMVIGPLIARTMAMAPRVRRTNAAWKTPAEISGMRYDNITFKSFDGLELTGWYVYPKAAANGSAASFNSQYTVVISHGLGSNKLEMFNMLALQFYNEGYAVLCYDFRNHGKSPDSAVGFTFALFEQMDLDAAIGVLQRNYHVAPNRIILWGVSTGGAMSLMMQARTGMPVAALISDCGFINAEKVVYSFAGLPSFLHFLVQISADFMSVTMIGTPLSNVGVEKYANQLSTPIFLIHGLNDTLVTPDHATTLYSLIKDNLESELWLLPDVIHARAILNPEYFPRVKQFLARLGHYREN